MSTEKSASFLSHINGLRGLAIVMVFFYHMQERMAPHGFIGVDIFLVISGYFLMKGFMKTPGEAALGGYLSRRVTRIYPAYLLTCLLVVLAAMPLFDADSLEKTAIIGLNALVGTSNVYLEAVSDGYFDAGVAELPLVHTWYLSVLLQCYLFFALGWWLMCRWPRKRVLWVLGCIALISFVIWNVPQIAKSLSKAGFFSGMPLPGYSYYWTTGRVWELLLGGGILLLPTLKNPGKWCRWTCLLLLVFLLVEAFISFKGLKRNNLPVVLAACALVWLLPAGGGLILRFFNNKLMQWLGTVSFSLYLVHWPIIVYWKWLAGPELGWLDYGGIMLLSVVGTALLYHGVEKRRFTLPQTLAAAVVPIGVMGAVWWFDGIPALHPEINSISSAKVTQLHALSDPAYDATLLQPFKSDHEGVVQYVGADGAALVPPENRLLLLGDATRKPDCIMFGDSHAGALRHGLNTVGRDAGFTVLHSPFYVTPFNNYTCNRYFFSPECYRAFFAWLDAHPELEKIIIVQCWAHRMVRNGGLNADMQGKPVRRVKFEKAAAGLRGFLLELQQRGKKVALLTAIPEVAAGNPGKYIRRCKLLGQPVDMSQISCTQEQYGAAQGRINAMLSQLEAEGLCTLIHQEKALLSDGCFEAWQEGGPLLMNDSFHLSPEGSVRSVEGMKEQIMRFLRLSTPST